jgi:formylglycine-generating enzyme required for sulfatase activity
VTLTRGFHLGRYEVTQRQYLALMGTNPSHFTGNLDRPVDNVSWEDATSYCAKLTIKEGMAGRLSAGLEYRLPTEAQWEYACRAGTTGRFYYGDDPGYTQLDKYAWYSGNSGGTTHTVGGESPNQWGLYDMTGDAMEWCLDWYGESLPGGSVTDPQGPSTGSSRVYRGGSWYDVPQYCRSASRNRTNPVNRNSGLGFRVVLVAVP